MSLAKKGTRHITINGSRFRWRVAPNDVEGMAIVVVSAASPAQRMITWVDHGNIISPWLVRRVVVQALSAGWSPERPGPELSFRIHGLAKNDAQAA